MKKQTFFLLASVIILAGSQLLRAQGSWVTVGNAGFSAGGVSFTSLALDGSGTPYVAYEDGGNSSKATVMKFDGNSNSWVLVGPAGFSAGVAYNTSLALDGNGTPYVAYEDNGNSGKATVMKFDGTNWVTVGNAGFSAGVADFVSLALDGSVPYVAYQDYGNSGKATVMKFDGTNWVTVGNAGFSTGTAQYISLALDGSTPYVAYGDNGYLGKGTVMKFDGANWVTVGPASFSAVIVTFISLALDGNGTPYVAYRDGSSGKATVMKFDGNSNSWVLVGPAGFSAGDTYNTSLALDGNGTPYVAYRDDGNSSKATVMKFDGNSNSWVTVGNAGFSAYSTSFTSLALDGSGTPYVAYRDDGNSKKATVMKFVPNQPPVADAGTNQTVIVNETVQLDGSSSSDPDSDPLTYSWSFYSKPAGSGATLSSTTDVSPTFEPDVAGDYVVQLVVNDGIVNSSPDQVTITALSPQQAIENLIALVISMNLNQGQTKSLTTKLYEAIDYLNNGDNAGAVDALNSFINSVEAQTGKKLTNEQADQLIAETQRIIDAINASSLPKQSPETTTLNSIPLAYHLDQNYPNPFNPTTQIQFGIPQAGNVTLKIYNSVGQLVKTLVDGNMSEGYHQVTWDATDNSGSKLSSGVYFYRITSGTFTQVNKMMLLK